MLDMLINLTSKSRIVDPLLDLGLVHQYGEGVGKEELTRAWLEPPPVIFCHGDAVLWGTNTMQHAVAVQTF